MKILFFILLTGILLTSSSESFPAAPPLPPNESDWLDQKPIQWSELRGKVVLLNVWTFACWNSYNSLPWVVHLQKKFPELTIIGIHSPEFDYEKDRKRLSDVMLKYNIKYQQILDDNHQYWKKLNNRYWPSFYIVDKEGQIRGQFVGETHDGDIRAKQMEEVIEKLTAE